VVRHLRQQPASQNIVVIAVSASAFPHILQESLEAGCDDFIAKPVQVKKLLDILQKYLHLEWIHASATEKNEKQCSSHQISPIIPDQETLRSLFKSAKRGHLKKILLQLDELEQSDTQYSPFVMRIRQFAKSFQMDRMCTYLEHYLQEQEG
jgi:response regulator of citrate/malate metabolism